MLKLRKVLAFCLLTLVFNSGIAIADHSTAHIDEQVPDEISGQFTIYSPNNYQISVKKEILIKGRNLMLTPVYVNGENIPLREDGRFYKIIPIPAKGPNVIYVSVWSPEQDFLTVRRVVFYQDAPPNADRLGDLKRIGIMILNSDYLDVTPNQVILTSSVSRYQFAYFLSRVYKGQNNSATSDIQFSDVPNTSPIYAKLKLVSSAHLITDFPDGSFRPDSKISKLEFIIGVVKALQLPLKAETEVEMSFRDVPKTHWANKYIATAVDFGLIPSSGKLNLNSDLSYEQFIALLTKIPAIKESLNPKTMVPTGDVQARERHFASLMRPKATPIAKLESNSISLSSPSNNLVTIEESIQFEGIISPPQATITINEFSVPVSKNGAFTYQVPITAGKNQIAVTAQKETVARTVYLVPTYKDMKGHWAEVVLAKMRYVGLIEDVPYLYPKSELTRELVAYYLSPLVNTDEVEEIPISDVPESNAFYPAIEKMVALKIIPLDSNGKFRPSTPVTREEMLEMFGRATHVEIPKSIPTRSIYSDISSRSPHYRYIYALRVADAIAKSNKIYPKRTATKIELLSLISRTEFVQNKMNSAFVHD